MRGHRVVVVVGVVVGLLIGGCRAGDEASEDVDAGQEAPSDDPAATGPPPSAEDLLAVVPGARDLPGGPWQYGAGVTELADDHEDEGPLSICGTVGGDGRANPLVHLLDDRSIEVGAGARYRDEGEATEVSLVVAVVPDAADHLRDAREGLPRCGDAGFPEIDWPAQGDEVAAFGITDDTMIGPDGGMPGSATVTLALVRVGEVVVGLTRRSVDAEWAELPPAPTDDELAALVGLAVDGVEALAAGEAPPTADGPTVVQLGEALPPVDALPGGPWERDVDRDPLAPGDEAEPVCVGVEGSAVGDVVAQRVPEGATATYEPEDRDSTVEVTVASGPIDGAAAAVASAGADLDACAAAGPDEDGFTLARLDDPDLGEAALAWRLTAGAEADRRFAPGTTITHHLVAVGDVVIWVAVTDEPADPGEPVGVTFDEAAVEAFVALAVEQVAALG